MKPVSIENLRPEAQRTLEMQLKRVERILQDDPRGFACLLDPVFMPIGTEARLILCIGPLVHPFEQLWAGLRLMEQAIEQVATQPASLDVPHTSSQEILEALGKIKKS